MTAATPSGCCGRDTATFELPTPDSLDPAAVRTVAVAGGADLLPVAGDWNGRDLVTLADLRQIYGEIPDEAKVAEGLPALNLAMRSAGIVTPARKAAFLATLRNESGFRFDAVEVGNESRYRGRGFIQLTGESNYRTAGRFLDLDLVGDPDLTIDGQTSVAIASWYWTVARDINATADRLDMAAVNIAIGFEPSPRTRHDSLCRLPRCPAPLQRRQHPHGRQLLAPRTTGALGRVVNPAPRAHLSRWSAP